MFGTKLKVSQDAHTLLKTKSWPGSDFSGCVHQADLDSGTLNRRRNEKGPEECVHVARLFLL